MSFGNIKSMLYVFRISKLKEKAISIEIMFEMNLIFVCSWCAIASVALCVCRYVPFVILFFFVASYSCCYLSYIFIVDVAARCYYSLCRAPVSQYSWLQILQYFFRFDFEVFFPFNFKHFILFAFFEMGHNIVCMCVYIFFFVRSLCASLCFLSVSPSVCTVLCSNIQVV